MNSGHQLGREIAHSRHAAVRRVAGGVVPRVAGLGAGASLDVVPQRVDVEVESGPEALLLRAAVRAQALKAAAVGVVERVGEAGRLLVGRSPRPGGASRPLRACGFLFAVPCSRATMDRKRKGFDVNGDRLTGVCVASGKIWSDISDQRLCAFGEGMTIADSMVVRRFFPWPSTLAKTPASCGNPLSAPCGPAVAHL